MSNISKKIGICLLSLFLGLVVAMMSVVAYAYFSKKEIYDGYFSGQVELLFDRLDENGMAAYCAAEGITEDAGADWGTQYNPYVISNVKHLYNLSELQNLGYFYNKHLSLTTPQMPYFLICTPDYKPVVIDGSSARAISSIGTDAYPFIGSIKGVTSVDDPETTDVDEAVRVTVGDSVCRTSVLHSVSVKGNPHNADVGLFGHVSFLGELPENDVTEFAGTPSVISNVVLSDVTVSVQSTLWAAVEAFIEEMAAAIAAGREGHRYSFTDYYGTDSYDVAPHENHHIGILAGHVEYSTIELISVFYSSGSVVAIDLSDTNTVGTTEANYLSAAGIIGFLYNMNPQIDEESGNIIAGSGDSLGDLSYDSMLGGGGGLSVGDMPGYILAGVIYNKYGYIAKDMPIADGAVLKIAEATDSEGNPLCEEWTGATIGSSGTSYYFYDGVFTFALSSTEDVIESTWVGDVPPEFALGANSPDAWKTNNKKGQKSVAAYIRQITSDKALQDAITAGSPLVIMREINAQTAFMMSLYNTTEPGTSGSFESRYATGATERYFATPKEIATFVESFGGSATEFIKGFKTGLGAGGVTEDDVRDLLEAVQDEKDDEIWKVINLNHTEGTDTSEDVIQKLRDEYKISANFVNGSYSYFNKNMPVTVGANGVNDYYDYAKSEYEGYLYYTVEEGLFNDTYTYSWQDIDGEMLEGIGSDTDGWFDDFDVTDFFKATEDNWQGETVYTATVDGVTYTGVLVNKTTGQFHGTPDNTAVVNGQYLYKLTGTQITYFYSPLGDDNYYYMTDTNGQNSISESSLTVKTDANGDTVTSESGLVYYQYTSGNNIYEGILVDRYYIYNFYSDLNTKDNPDDDNYLRMIKAVFATTGTKYTLWNANDDDAQDTSNFRFGTIWDLDANSVTSSTNATVRFNDDGTCYIQYSIDTVTQFVNFNVGEEEFNTSLSATDSTKLCIYALEYTQALDYGTITFDPVGTENDDYHILGADEYVFWPEDSTVAVQGNGVVKSSVNGVGTQYSVVELESLAWRNGDATDNGGILHGGNLLKKFRMEESIAFGANIGGFIGTSGLVRAPVGPEGTYTDIPAGCVAFRVNQTSTEAHKIRVIVAVPVSDYYPGEKKYDLGDYTRYFCLWQMDESDGSGSTIFQSSDYIERFEVPRSHTYRPGTTAASDTSEYVTVTYNGEEYRSYLNGDRILVAYEFKVYNEGVYVLGTSNSENDQAGLFDDPTNTPMEILYFSADGVADTGYDGSASGQLGTLDYVYSYGGEIVTVTERSSTEEGELDYSTYYQSYCLVYMNSKLDDEVVNIKNEQVYVRRYVATGTPESSEGYNTNADKQTVIAIIFGGDKYTRLTQHSQLSDNVVDESQ